MKFKLINRELTTVLFSSIITSSTLVALPSQASTFAFSEGIFGISLSQNPLDTFTDARTNTLTISEDSQSSAVAIAEAQATLVSGLPSDELTCNFNSLTISIPLPAGCNISSSLASGEGSSYFGLAQSQAQLVGNFFVESGSTFSFDFLASLFLETFSDNPEFKTANAFGEISFQLFDSMNGVILDSFTITSQLAGFGDSSFLSIFQESENITFDFLDLETDFSGNYQLAQTTILGNYSRFFSNNTYLTLIETKTNQALVQATPEPSSIFAFLFSLGLAQIGLRSKRLKTNKCV